MSGGTGTTPLKEPAISAEEEFDNQVLSGKSLDKIGKLVDINGCTDTEDTLVLNRSTMVMPNIEVTPKLNSNTFRPSHTRSLTKGTIVTTSTE